MNIKLVVTDLDKTFLKTDGTISERNLYAIRELRTKKIITAFATGRSLYSLQKVIPPNFPVDFVIFSTGLGILDFATKEIIRENYLKISEVEEIFTVLSDLKIDFMLHSPIPKNHYFLYKTFQNKADFQRRIKIYNAFCRPFSEESELNEASQFIAISEVESDFELIKNKLSNYDVIRATSPLDHKSLWIEIFPKNTSKGIAIKQLKNKFKLNYDNIFSIGNDFNDLDMLKVAGKSYVVDNAPKELRDSFETTKSNDEDGFYFALRDLNLIK